MSFTSENLVNWLPNLSMKLDEFCWKRSSSFDKVSNSLSSIDSKNLIKASLSNVDVMNVFHSSNKLSIGSFER